MQPLQRNELRQGIFNMMLVMLQTIAFDNIYTLREGNN